MTFASLKFFIRSRLCWLIGHLPDAEGGHALCTYCEELT